MEGPAYVDVSVNLKLFSYCSVPGPDIGRVANMASPRANAYSDHFRNPEHVDMYNLLAITAALRGYPVKILATSQRLFDRQLGENINGSWF